MKLRIFGQRNSLGGGVHFGNFCDALARYNGISGFFEEVDSSRPEEVAQAVDNSSDQDINIIFWLREKHTKLRGKKIIWSIFESDYLPDAYIAELRSPELIIWVPSAWGKDVLIQHGLKSEQIDVVPEGVNPTVYHPFLRRVRPSSPKPFKFLMVGKYEERKGYTQLLEAFRMAFGDSADRQLIIKADYFINPASKQQEIELFLKKYELPNVKLVSGNLKTEDMFLLYSHADCFVFPSRAEGWGLPLIEALACGTPCITTCYSGHSEYLQKISDRYLPIPHTLVSNQDPEYGKCWPDPAGNQGNWAEADVEKFAEQLIFMESNYADMQVMGFEASNIIRQLYSWEKIAERAIRTLQIRGGFPAINI